MLDGELHNAQRALEDVTASVGPVREQIVRAAANLAAQQRFIEKLDETDRRHRRAAGSRSTRGCGTLEGCARPRRRGDRHRRPCRCVHEGAGPVSARPGPQCCRRSRVSRIFGWMPANTSPIWASSARSFGSGSDPARLVGGLHPRPRGGGRLLEWAPSRGCDPGRAAAAEP